MTAASTSPAAGSGPAQRLPGLADTAVILVRNLRRLRRNPRLSVVSLVQPVLFVLLFRYAFGGSIRIPGVTYIDYLLPGIFITATLFGATTAVAMATDMASGVIDRFRSLPMARPAVLAARCLADLARSAAVVALVLAVGMLLGFRFHNGVLPALAALGMVLAAAFAFMWMFALVSLLVRDPETAQLASFLPVFSFIFASSVFVPASSMPGWLQAFAKVQPVSVTVDKVRTLAEGGPVAHWAWQSGSWIAGCSVVFGFLAVIRYRAS